MERMRPYKQKARLSSRHNRKKGARLYKLAALLALCVLLSGGAYYAAHSRYFAIREIILYGNNQLSDRDLMRIMGIQKSGNIFAVSSEELFTRLMGSPWIQDARLRKEFPGRLMVRVEESVPSALLRDDTGLSLIDRRGRVLEKLKGEAVPFLPIIMDPTSERAGAFNDALVLAAVVKDEGIAAETGTVEIGNFSQGAENITVTIRGLKARVGKGRYREKLARLFELEDEIKRRDINVDYVDLRFDDRVVVKPVSAVAKLGDREGAARGR